MLSYVRVSTSSSLGRSHHGLNKALDRHFDQPRVLSRVPVSDLGFRSTGIMGTSSSLAFLYQHEASRNTPCPWNHAGRWKCSLIPSLFFSPPTQSLGMRVLAFIDLAYEKHLAYLKLNHEHLLTVFSFPLTPFPLGSYLNAIQTCCPHILRYVTAAVITNKRRQSLLKDLIRVIRQVQSHSHIPFQ